MSINVNINDNDLFETTFTRIDAARTLIDYCNTLMRDIMEGYLYKLIGERWNSKVLINIEGEYAVSKAEMVWKFLGELETELDAIAGLLHEPRAAAAAAEQTPTTDEERIAEISCDVIKAISQIARRPDWPDALKDLNAVAWKFANGSREATKDD